MKYSIVLAATFWSVAAAAQLPTTPPAPPPKAVYIPTAIVGRILVFFGDPKIAEMLPLYASDVRPLLDQLAACARIQIPDPQGRIISHGECPEIQEMLRATPPAVAKDGADNTAPKL